MCSAIGQMRAHLTNCVRIWSLLVGFTKCAAHLGKRAAQLAKCARIWSTARAFGQTRAHFTKRCAFGQMPRVLPIGQMRCANWPNAPYNYTNTYVI